MEKDAFQEEGTGQEEEVEEVKINEWDDAEDDNLDFITEYKEETDEDGNR